MVEHQRMKVALLGYGQMARVLEAHVREAGHDVGAVLTSRNAADAARLLPGHTVAIDFSAPGAAVTHVAAAVAAAVPLVLGTTGWQNDEARVRQLVEARNGALIYGPNFSVGVNLFYRIVTHAARVFLGVAGYDPFIEESHHARKRDAPSGTALALQAIVSRELGGQRVPVTSTRAGHNPGIHRVGLDSAADEILLVHTARSRLGFAVGALLAARWIVGRTGVYRFADVLDDLLAQDQQLKGKVS